MTTDCLASIMITDIPWQRLTTPYGRGSDLPQLLSERAYDKIAELIEHQSTLWQVTPWALLFLLRELKTKHPNDVLLAELHVYQAAADALAERDWASLPHVQQPVDLLGECFLWPVDEEEDELLWEDDEPRGYEELPFSSYYYYSGLLLDDAIPDFERLREGNSALSSHVSELLKALGTNE